MFRKMGIQQIWELYDLGVAGIVERISHTPTIKTKWGPGWTSTVNEGLTELGLPHFDLIKVIGEEVKAAKES